MIEDVYAAIHKVEQVAFWPGAVLIVQWPAAARTIGKTTHRIKVDKVGLWVILKPVREVTIVIPT